MSAIIGADYQNNIKELEQNEVVVRLAARLVHDQIVFKKSLTELGITHESGSPTHDFMMAVNNHLNENGVINRTHIGAGSTAVLNVHRTVADKVNEILNTSL